MEFVIGADKESQLEQVRAKLAAAGLEEMPGGETDIPPPLPKPADTHRNQRRLERRERRRDDGPRQPTQPNAEKLHPKPYGFVPLPDQLTTAPPIWHDGSGVKDRLSGEIRCQLETLTPLLVGWERRQIDNAEEPWPIRHTSVGGDSVEVHINGTTARTTKKKFVLCALRAPWGDRPVLLSGDSIKGLLRHELGALLGTPMERVAERSYSYRPNLRYSDDKVGRMLEPRLARVKSATTVSVVGQDWPFPSEIDVLQMATRSDQKYYPRRQKDPNTGRWHEVRPPQESQLSRYRGGLGGGQRLPDKVLSDDARRRTIHTHIDIGSLADEHGALHVGGDIKKKYAQTLSHLLDSDAGHFSARHPHVGTDQKAQRAATDAIRKAACSAFQPGDLIWVEWDTQKKCIVSLGWHYYYRWAYVDTVRREGWTLERHGLFPLEAEKDCDADGAPRGLSAVRRLFGYTFDKENEGVRNIGRSDHQQLMGRIAVNAAIEIVELGGADNKRFLPPTFLKELGMPRPSAVEHYLEQPYYPKSRPSDRARLVTYGDAAGYDTPGKLAGRKFYLDCKDAYTGEPWKDETEANRLNDRSTLALEASHPGRRFRFTLRFRDLDPAELAAILAALCPHQFREILGGDHPDGYCSKLGYARPLGWGSVRIEAKALLLLDTSDKPALAPIADLSGWMRTHFVVTPMLEQWFAIHKCKHPEASSYPTAKDKDGRENITYHTNLRAVHSRDRRYAPESRQ